MLQEAGTCSEIYQKKMGEEGWLAWGKTASMCINAGIGKMFARIQRLTALPLLGAWSIQLISVIKENFLGSAMYRMSVRAAAKNK